jgi:hypothetical protein
MKCKQTIKWSFKSWLTVLLFFVLTQSNVCLAQLNVLDSLDKIANRPTAERLLLSGYTHLNRKTERFWNIGPLLQNLLQFNTVEGFVLSENIGINRGLPNHQFLNFGLATRYGFSNQKFGIKTHLNYLFDRRHDLNIKLEAGQYVSQFSAIEPIGVFNNTITSLFWGQNFMKLYQKKFVQLSFKGQANKAIGFDVSTALEERQAMLNSNLYSFRASEKRAFTSNDPQNSINQILSFDAHQALLLEVELKILPEKWQSAQQTSNNWPQFSINYRVGRNEINFDRLQIRATQLIQTRFGDSRWGFIASTFLNNSNVQFMDYQHFLGNQSAFGSNKPEAFAMLDSYGYSTKTKAIQVYFKQNFQGYFLGKIPIFKQLAWHEVFTTRVLYTPEQNFYGEIGLGIDNIFQTYRLDFISSLTQHKARFGIRFGIAF